MPKVSIVMNCLNGENFVRQALQSVYDQTFQDWEIIFWDNASTDSTPDIAKSFDDGRLRYYRSQETVPLGEARQWAMAEARGEWVAILDHDDRFLPHRLERQLQELAHGDYALCYSGYRNIDEDGSLLGTLLPRYRSGAIFGELLVDFEINVATVMMKRQILSNLDLQAIGTFVMAEEYNIYLNLAARGDVCVVPEVLVEYRYVPNSWTEKALGKQVPEVAATLAQLKRDFPALAARHAGQFIQAEAKNTYTAAKVQMRSGQHASARATLKSIRPLRKAYFFLWLLAFLPPLWSLVHRRDIKAKLTSLFLQRQPG